MEPLTECNMMKQRKAPQTSTLIWETQKDIAFVLQTHFWFHHKCHTSLSHYIRSWETEESDKFYRCPLGRNSSLSWCRCDVCRIVVPKLVCEGLVELQRHKKQRLKRCIQLHFVCPLNISGGVQVVSKEFKR